MNYWTLSILLNTWVLLLERGNISDISSTISSMKDASEACKQAAKEEADDYADAKFEGERRHD